MPTDAETEAEIQRILDEIDRTEGKIAFLDGLLSVLYPACVVINLIAFVSNLARGEWFLAAVFAVITVLWTIFAVKFFREKD